MAHIEVPERFANDLRELALHDRRPVEEVVDEAINSYIVQRIYESPLSPDHIEHLKRGIAQLDRGEYLTSQEVDDKFEVWRKRRAAL